MDIDSSFESDPTKQGIKRCTTPTDCDECSHFNDDKVSWPRNYFLLLLEFDSQQRSSLAQRCAKFSCSDCTWSTLPLGGLVWCQCCANNCGGFRADCVAKSGFCNSRCTALALCNVRSSSSACYFCFGVVSHRTIKDFSFSNSSFGIQYIIIFCKKKKFVCVRRSRQARPPFATISACR